MKIFLGLLGRKGLFLKFNEEGLVKQLDFTDADQNHLSSKMDRAFHDLLENSNEKQKISELICLAGPASFTGLRMSAAFMQGLSIGLSIPIRPLATALLLQKSAALPLRHILAENLEPTEYFKKGYQSIVLNPSCPEGPFETLTEFQEGIDYIGHRGGLDILNAPTIWNALKKGTLATQEFKIIYGLTPKVTGQRLPH